MSAFSHFGGPAVAVVGTKLPRCEVVLHVAEHTIPLLRRIAFFHDHVALELVDNIERMNEHGAGLHAGLASGTGAQFFRRNIIVQQYFAIIGGLPIAGAAQHFHAVARVHHDLARRE